MQSLFHQIHELVALQTVLVCSCILHCWLSSWFYLKGCLMSALCFCSSTRSRAMSLFPRNDLTTSERSRLLLVFPRAATLLSHILYKISSRSQRCVLIYSVYINMVYHQLFVSVYLTIFKQLRFVFCSNFIYIKQPFSLNHFRCNRLQKLLQILPRTKHISVVCT